MLRRAQPNRIILDLWLTQRDDGWEFLKRLWGDCEMEMYGEGCRTGLIAESVGDTTHGYELFGLRYGAKMRAITMRVREPANGLTHLTGVLLSVIAMGVLLVIGI